MILSCVGSGELIYVSGCSPVPLARAQIPRLGFLVSHTQGGRVCFVLNSLIDPAISVCPCCVTHGRRVQERIYDVFTGSTAGLDTINCNHDFSTWSCHEELSLFCAGLVCVKALDVCVSRGSCLPLQSNLPG